jgi:hypothetical protein
MKDEEISGRVTLEDLIGWGLASGQKYSISDEELVEFQKEIVMNAAKLFPGYTNRTNDFFVSLIEYFSTEEQKENYLKRLSNLNIRPRAFMGGRTYLGSADSIHRGFLLFAKIKGEEINGRVTLEDLKRWGIPLEQKYSISNDELVEFQEEIVMNASTLFPGYAKRTNDFFISLAEYLPTEKQKEEYLKKLSNLNISQHAFLNSRTHLGSADSIHRGFLLFAKIKGEEFSERVTQEDLKRWGLTLRQKYSISKEELEVFQEEIVMDASTLFPGYTHRTNDFFISLAKYFSAEEQKEDYLKRLSNLNIKQQAFPNGKTQLGSADSVHRGFLLFAKIKGEEISGRITLEDLKNWGIVK